MSNTLTGSFCLEALDEALSRHPRGTRPEISNSAQESQFTATACTLRLESCGVAISMDGRGRAIDTVFIERLWRSVKYEEVYLRDYADGWHAAASLAAYFRFYNEERIHQALGYRTPWAVYCQPGSSGAEPPDENQIEIARNKGIAGLYIRSFNHCSGRAGPVRGPAGASPNLFNPFGRPANGVHRTRLAARSRSRILHSARSSGKLW